MLTLFIRAFVLYLVMLLALRGMGKHQLGKFQPYEFAMAMLIADLVSTPMSNVSTPLLHGVLPVAALFITHAAISLICLRSDKARAFISGKPALLINNGVIDRAELLRLSLSLSDLTEGLRAAGLLDPKDVGTAILEANGLISAFPAAASRPPTTAELNVTPAPEGLPLLLILDGHIQPHNLKMSGRGEQWLKDLLARYGLSEKTVLLASLAKTGLLHIQDMDGALLEMRALTPGEVRW